MKWFRFYHEVCRDPKVQMMRAELFRFWINVLCVASESKNRGRIESEDHLRLALGLDRATTKRWLSELEALALLHRSFDGVFTPHNWDARQPESDDSSIRKRHERLRSYDDDHFDMSRPMSRDVSRDVSVTGAQHERNGTVTEAQQKENESVSPDSLSSSPPTPPPISSLSSPSRKEREKAGGFTASRFPRFHRHQ